VVVRTFYVRAGASWPIVDYAQSVSEFPGGIFRTSGGVNLYLLLSTKKEPKSLPPDTMSEFKMYPKCFCGLGMLLRPGLCPEPHWGSS